METENLDTHNQFMPITFFSITLLSKIWFTSIELHVLPFSKPKRKNKQQHKNGWPEPVLTNCDLRGSNRILGKYSSL